MSPRPPLRVLGIDPGLTRCGIGVVQGPPSSPVFVAVDLVRTDREAPIAARLDAVHRGVAAAIAVHRPDVVACEQVLFSRNVRTAIGTAQALGVALLAAEQADLPAFTYAPTHVKSAVTGYGAADKEAVVRMVTRSLRLDAPPRPADLADALAVALCHLVQDRLTAVDARAGRASQRSDLSRSDNRGGGWEQVVAARGLRVVGGTDGPESR